MKNLRLRRKVARSLDGSSRGVTLIEVLIALALFTIIAIVFISGLTVAARSVFIGDQRTTAESLARAQMEYVKSQAYSDAPWDYMLTHDVHSGESGYLPDWWDPEKNIPPKLDSMYHSYAVKVEAEVIDNENGEDPDPGLQQITVTVRHDDKVVFTLVGYNMDR